MKRIKHLLHKTTLAISVCLLFCCSLPTQAQDDTKAQLKLIQKLERKYKDVSIFNNDFIQVHDQSGYCGIFHKNGSEIIPTQYGYKYIEWNNNAKCFEVYKKAQKSRIGPDAVYAANGVVVVPPGNYTSVKQTDYHDYYEVGTKVGNEYTYGAYKTDGQLLVAPGKYKSISVYSYAGGTEVTTMGFKHYGFVAFGGREVIPPIYTSLYVEFNGAFIIAWKDEKVTLFDNKGNVVVPEGKYDAIYYDWVGKTPKYQEEGKILRAYKGGESLRVKGNYFLFAGKIALIDGRTGKPVLDLVDGSSVDWPDYPKGDIIVYSIGDNGDTVATSHYSPEGKLIYNVGTPIKAMTKEELAMWKRQWQDNKDKNKVQATANTVKKAPETTPNDDTDINIPKTDKTSPETYAFIVANENYPQRNVPFAIHDGKVFREYCEKTLGIPANHIRFYADATSANLVACVEQMKQASIANSGQLSIIFYYAGHAFPDEQTKSAYLLPVDGQTNLLSTCYSLSSLYKDLSALQAKNITCFIDACFSGATRENEMLLAGRGVAIKPKADVPRGNVVVFTSASGAETAHQYKDKKHGLFTYYLLKKLQDSKGNVTLGELGDYITANVKRTSFDVNDKIQTPTVIPSATMSTKWRNIKL